jgi:hypothetical protein
MRDLLDRWHLVVVREDEGIALVRESADLLGKRRIDWRCHRYYLPRQGLAAATVIQTLVRLTP